MGDLIRVRLASEQEIIARARRNGSAGAWLIERKYTMRGGGFFWDTVSSHLTEDAANKAAKRQLKKLA